MKEFKYIKTIIRCDRIHKTEKHMTNREMLAIAMRQSAEDIGCRADDFLRTVNTVVPYRMGTNARKYLQEPITCTLVSYGNNVVAAVLEDTAEIVSSYIERYEFYHCFETPNRHWLNDRLMGKGHKICFMAEYYLPDMEKIPDLKCPFEVRILEQKDFDPLYRPEWSNALCRERKNLDIMGAGAYDDGKLVGLAGCSADCEEMWQIGVDVLPTHRGLGLGPALTGRLTAEIFEREKVPFYCAAWSNLRSVRTALRCGFRPAWLEITARDSAYTDSVLRE